MSMVVFVEKIVLAYNLPDFRPINMMSAFETTTINRQLHSRESDLNYVIADWKCEIDNKNVILAVFVDLKRAFETIDRDVLLKR